MKITPLTYFVLIVALSAISSHAAIILSSSIPSAPLGGVVVAQNLTGDGTGGGVTLEYISSNYVAGDNGSGANVHMLGQSFTTGNLGANNQLATISVQSTSGSWANYGGSMTIRLFEVVGYSTNGGSLSDQSLIDTWTYSTNGTAGVTSPLGTTATWFTFDLAGTTLQDNTTYAFTLETFGTGQNLNGTFFEWNGTSQNVYSGGQAMSQDYADQPNQALWFGQGASLTGDRVFQVTAVPETSSLFLGLLGATVCLRRRRN
jgi:hypothetical protein